MFLQQTVIMNQGRKGNYEDL